MWPSTPDTDRHWHGLLVFSSLFVLGSLVAIPIFLIVAVTQSWGTGGSLLDHLDLTQPLSAGLFALFGLSLRREALCARDRNERRARFLAGDTAAIPLAKDPLLPNGANPLPALPLELSGKGVTGMSSLARLRGCAFFPLLLIVPALLLIAGVLASSPINHFVRGGGAITIYATLGVTVVAEVLLFRRFLRLNEEPLAGRVIAIEEGLVRPQRRRAPTLIRWQDARLLEAASSSQRQRFTRVLSLQSANTSVSWYEVPGGDSGKQGAFLAVVEARTGLLPRTFSPALQQPDLVPVGTAALAPARNPAWVYLVILLFAALLLALGAALLLVPLTGILPLDVAVTLSFALPGLYIIFYSLRIRLREVRQLHPLTYALPIAPSLVGSTDLLANGVSPIRRLLNGGMAALFILDFPAVIIGYT